MHKNPAKTLDIRGLSKRYPLPGGRSAPAVRNFSLRVEPGEFVTLLGPSGCGKTTVLRTLAGLENADEGEILLDGRPIQSLPSHRRRVGMVFQNYALFPHMSVHENVAYSLRIRKVSDERARVDVAAALKAVGLDDMGTRLPGQLSGGQQQRVALARALVMQPDLLLFDEPLSNLDAKLRVQVRAELRRLQKRLGTTAIYVTHDQDEAMALSDRIAVMNAGQVEQVGSPETIYARPASLFVADFVGQVNAIPGHVAERSGASVRIAALGQHIVVGADRCPADEVVVLVRPEAIRIGDVHAEAASGTVEEVEYRGDRVEYRVRIGGALIIAVEPALGRGARNAGGDRVGVQIVADAVHLLPAQGAASVQMQEVAVPPPALSSTI